MTSFQVGCTCPGDLLLLEEPEFAEMAISSLERRRLVKSIAEFSKSSLPFLLARGFEQH